MKFAKYVFRAAGIFGLMAVPPLYFLREHFERMSPPAITHPEFYYSFVGFGIAWQIAFVIISTDPVRFRPLMPAAVFEKFSYVIAVIVLYIQGQYQGSLVASVGIDLLLGLLFVAAFFRTPRVRPLEA